MSLEVVSKASDNVVSAVISITFYFYWQASSYSRISSLSTAISKVKNKLPKSPRKRKSIIKAFTPEYLENCTATGEPTESKPGPRVITKAVEDRVK